MTEVPYNYLSHSSPFSKSVHTNKFAALNTWCGFVFASINELRTPSNLMLHQTNSILTNAVINMENETL